jgi:rhamnosyltransferase
MQHKCNNGDLPGADDGMQSEYAKASVAAVVVLFHPYPPLVDRLITSIATQVDGIFVVDNTPGTECGGHNSMMDGARPIFHLAYGMNKGLATAQNAGIEAAMRKGYTHVLLLDQDSALPADAVARLLVAERSLLQRGIEVAAVGPLFIDEKTGERSRGVRHSWLRVRWFPIHASETRPIETDYLIASGSLMRISILKRVGLMRDELFIDWVDTEWAYRAQSYGYRAFIVPGVVMRHSVGDAMGQFLGKSFTVHSAARNYYIVRNAVYLLREKRMSPRWRITMLIYIPKYILVHSWLSSHRWASLKQMLWAIWEGSAGTMRPFASQ